jgi:ATP-dependent protease Clp ATPase subunit
MKVEVLACDFCRKTQHQVEHLVRSRDTAICDKCIDICFAIVAKERKQKSERKS